MSLFLLSRQNTEEANLRNDDDLRIGSPGQLGSERSVRCMNSAPRGDGVGIGYHSTPNE